MVKTTTKTNFTKAVKYKVGTIRAVVELMANVAICEGDCSKLDGLYDMALIDLESFALDSTNRPHTYGASAPVEHTGDDNFGTPAELLHDKEEKSKMAALVDFLYSHPDMEVGDLFDDNGNLNCLGDDVLTSGDSKKVSDIVPNTYGLKEFCEKAYHTSDPDEAARLAAAGAKADDVADDDTEEEGSDND